MSGHAAIGHNPAEFLCFFLAGLVGEEAGWILAVLCGLQGLER
jgi:hypothetical protein